MPFAHDRPSLEESVAAHDAQAVAPGSTEADCTALQAWLQRAPAGPLLDIACGSGRHVRALGRSSGRPCHGIDCDPRMIAAARAADPAGDYRCGDASATQLGGPFALITLLNRSLVCFHSHRQACGLFTQVAAALAPGGFFCIDNCCTPMWDEVRAGNYADGLAEDGSEQFFLLPGENRFVWRRGPAVDSTCWTVREDDRLYRLWSLGEIALAAWGAGLTAIQLDHATPLIVVQAAQGR